MGEFSALLTNMAQLGIKVDATDEIILVNNDAQSDSIKTEQEVTEGNEEESEADTSKRSLRKRSASDDSLHKTRNRKIQRPRKNSASMQFETEKEVKNFYVNINKKFKSIKPNQLETIFEEDESISEVDDIETKDTGRKLKRTLAICDGFNITKALKDKRKGLIKKHLGNKKKPKKIALSKFMEFFKEKVSRGDDVMEEVN